MKETKEKNNTLKQGFVSKINVNQWDENRKSTYNFIVAVVDGKVCFIKDYNNWHVSKDLKKGDEIAFYSLTSVMKKDKPITYFLHSDGDLKVVNLGIESSYSIYNH